MPQLGRSLSAASPEPFEEKGRWGFRESGGGVITPPLFEQVSGFSEGLAPVRLAGKWGYINEAGEILLEPRYLTAGQFSGGAAQVRLAGGEWGIINSSGNVLFSSTAPVLGVPSEGLTLFAAGGKFGYRNEAGKEAIPAGFSGAGPFSAGLAPAAETKWGFINKSGDFAIKPEFDGARAFSEGRAAFLSGGKWGFLDRKGRTAIKNVFSDAREFSEGLAAVKFNTWWGYIDAHGRVELAPDYSEAGQFSNGLARVVMSSGPAAMELWIGRDGGTVYRGAGPAGEGLEIIVSTSGEYGLAENNVPLIPPSYEAVAGCAAGLCLVKKDGGVVFVDHEGNIVSRTDYSDAASLGCGVYRVERGREYGLLSSTGGLIAEIGYDSIGGSACAKELLAVRDGSAGTLDPESGAFVAGASVGQPRGAGLSGKCAGVSKTLESMDYRKIPSYCGADELRSLAEVSTGCLNCRLALAEIYSSTASSGAPADAEAALDALSGAIKLSTSPAELYRWSITLLISSPTLADGAARLAGDYAALARLEPSTSSYADACRAYAGLTAPPPDPQDALSFCDQALSGQQTSDGLYLARANLKLLLGDRYGALADMHSALALAPGDVPARMKRAALSYSVGQYYRTVFDCGKVLEADNNNTDALEERALAYMRMGLCDRAMRDLEQAGRVRSGAGNLRRMAVYNWVCQKDAFSTLALVEALVKPSAECGGPCWKQGDFSEELADFYASPEYRKAAMNGSLPWAQAVVSTSVPQGLAPSSATVEPVPTSTAPAAGASVRVSTGGVPASAVPVAEPAEKH